MNSKKESNIKGNLQSRREFARKLALAGTAIPLAGAVAPLVAKTLPTKETGSTNTPVWSSRESARTDSVIDPFSVNIFSKHLQFLDYEEMADASAEAGVDGVDLTVRPEGHVLPENVERDLPRAVKAIRAAGLNPAMMATGITDPDDPLTERVLGTASEQGIRYYRLDYYHYDHEIGIVRSLDLIRDKMTRLTALNEKYGIHGAYQNHEGTNFGAPVWDLWGVVRDLDGQWTGCQYDIRHATVEGAKSWILGLELLKHHIRCMVIKDFEWEKVVGRWRIRNVPVGTGMVDFDDYFFRLQGYGIAGPISLHIEYPLYPDENMTVAEKKAAAIRTIRREVEAIRAMLPAS